MKALLGILCVLTCAVAVGQQSTTNATTVRFQAVDIYVDSGNSPLAAYQLEFTVTAGSAKIAGIEGGEHAAFAQPPFYDPKAMQQERVVLAAYRTDSDNKLPKGRTRVVTIHLQVSGRGELKFESKLQAAASSNGDKIKAELSVEKRSVK